MQKFMKIVVVFLLVLSLGLPSAATSSVAAEQWTEYPANTTGDLNKAWKVTFSDLVNSSTVSQENVYVKKANGQPMDVTVTVNGSTITVTPKAPYTIGETYTLYLHSSIQSINEQSLPNTKFQFTVLSALEIAKSVAQEAKDTAQAIKTGQPVFANPFAGTKDELTRANAFVADLEKAIAAANVKIEAADALIKTAKASGATDTELAGANANVNAAKKAITEAAKAVDTAKQAIDTASISTQLAVAKVEVQSTSSVKVKLATTPAYELTKADADKFRVNMDGTLLQVTDVVKSSDNLEYTLTIATATTKYPLFGKQGILSVNNTRAVIPNSEFGYDFKAPTIDKVEVLDSRHVRVTFSENMGDSAATVGNYDIYKAKTTTPDLLTGTGAVAVLSTDRKSVTLTLGGKNELAAGDYTLKVTGVTDVAGNNIRPNTTIEFPVTKDQLVDTTRPSLTAADYDSENGILNVTFDEKVTIEYLSRFSLEGVALASKSTTSSNEGTKYQITLTDAKKLDVNNIIKNPLKLTISAGAVKDVALNNNLSTNYDLTVAVPPKAIQASYSEYTKRLRVTFDQPIQMANVDKTKFGVTVKGTTTHTLTGGTIISTENGTTLTIELTKADSQKIEKDAGEAETGTLQLAAGAVKNTTDKQTVNGAQTNIPLTYLQDTGKPRVENVIVSAVPNYNNDTIEVEFTEPMEEGSAKNLANYEFKHGNGDLSKADPVTLTNENATIQMSADLKKVTITLKGIDLQIGTDYSLQVSNVIDLTGEMLDPELRTEKVGGDKNPPTIKSVSAIAGDDEDIITIEFSEAVKKDTAEKIGNYTIDKLTLPATPNSIAYVETDTDNDGVMDKFEVIIKYKEGTLPEHGEVTVKNATDPTKRVVDLAGNSMADLTPALEVSVTDKVAPSIEKVQGKTVQNGFDEIIVTFSENVTKATAENPLNYQLEVEENNVPLTNLKAGEDIKYDPTTFTATLYLDTSSKRNGHDADDYALKNGQSIKITVTNVEDDNMNKIIVGNNFAEGKVDHSDNDKLNASLIVDSEDKQLIKVMGAYTIQLSWDEELDGDTLFANEFVLKKTDGVLYQISKATLDETKKNVILTIKDAIAFNEDKLVLSLEGSQLTDYAGIPVTSLTEVPVIALDNTTTSYSLVGSGVESSVSKKSIKTDKNQQISKLFKLRAGTTANGEGFTVETISLDVKTTLAAIDKVQLMWSTDAKVGNDVAVSEPKINMEGLLTFEDIQKEIASAGEGYFYVEADVSYAGTITVDFVGATAISTQTKFNVVSLDNVSGEKITVDTMDPKVEFLASDSSTEIKIKVVDDSPLAFKKTGLELKPLTNYNESFEIVGTPAGTTIQSAIYNFDAGEQTFTITTSAGLPTDGFIRLKAGELIDLAGNPLAATFIAQGNGTSEKFVNPYILNDETDYSGDVIQNKLEEGNVIYGPYKPVAKKVDGNVRIIGASAGTITLQNLNITGNLTISTPNSAVVIGENVTVDGKLIIEDISSTGLTNNGTLTDVVILNKQGTSFINNNGTISENVDVNSSESTAVIKLGGKISTVNVLKPAKLQIESGATITTLTVEENITADITNNGVITTLEGEGTAIERAKKAGAYAGNIGKNTAIQAIKDAPNANAIETVLIAYYSQLGITGITDYTNLASTYKSTVNTLLYNGRNSYADEAAIKTAFEDAVDDQKVQLGLDKVAASITRLSVLTGATTLPIAEGYTFKVKTTSSVAIYNADGKGISPGSATVVYTVTHDVTGKQKDTGNVAVTVSASATAKVTSKTIKEDAQNNGSITEIQTVTLTNGSFVTDQLTKTDVTIANLPAGLDYEITDITASQFKIKFTGAASQHANADDVANVSITLRQAKINGATASVTTDEFKIDFNDPAVNALALDALITAPVQGATPNLTAIDQTQYAGTIQWFESNGTTAVTGNFEASKVYVAKVTLTAKTGYTLTGVKANSFTYTGATVVNAANSGVITITFPETAVDPTAGATAELAKVTDAVVKTVPSSTTNDKASVEAAMLVLANAAVDSAYTVTIASGSTYNAATNAWVGKFVVTNKTTGTNTKTDAADRNIIVVIDTE